MTRELHIGIKFEPDRGGAHVGKLEAAPNPDLLIPETTLVMEDVRAHVWWLDGEIPADESVRQELENVASGLAARHLDEAE